MEEEAAWDKSRAVKQLEYDLYQPVKIVHDIVFTTLVLGHAFRKTPLTSCDEVAGGSGCVRCRPKPHSSKCRPTPNTTTTSYIALFSLSTLDGGTRT